MKCECGSTKMYRYFLYASKKIECFRCLECGDCYKVQGTSIQKLELPPINKDAWDALQKWLKQEFEIN